MQNQTDEESRVYWNAFVNKVIKGRSDSNHKMHTPVETIEVKYIAVETARPNVAMCRVK